MSRITVFVTAIGALFADLNLARFALWRAGGSRSGRRLGRSLSPRRAFFAGADNAQLTKRGRAAANIGRRQGAAFTRLSGRTTLPLFMLVPQVTVRKRLDVDGAAQQWIRALPRLVLRHWQR